MLAADPRRTSPCVDTRSSEVDDLEKFTKFRPEKIKLAMESLPLLLERPSTAQSVTWADDVQSPVQRASSRRSSAKRGGGQPQRDALRSAGGESLAPSVTFERAERRPMTADPSGTGGGWLESQSVLQAMHGMDPTNASWKMYDTEEGAAVRPRSVPVEMGGGEHREKHETAAAALLVILQGRREYALGLEEALGDVAHQARQSVLATEALIVARAPAVIVELMEHHYDNPEVQLYGCHALSELGRMCCEAERHYSEHVNFVRAKEVRIVCRRLIEMGSIGALLRTMDVHPATEVLMWRCCEAIVYIAATSKKAVVAVADAGVIDRILTVAARHSLSWDCVYWCCRALEELTVEATSAAIAAAGVPAALRAVLARHPETSDIHAVGTRVFDRITAKAASAAAAERERAAADAERAAADEAAAAAAGKGGSKQSKKKKKKKKRVKAKAEEAKES